MDESDERMSVEVRLPALLVTRLRVMLRRRHRSVSRRMVEREIVRRLRVSFAIDDLVSEAEGQSDA